MSEQFQDNLQLLFALIYSIITVGGAILSLIEFKKIIKEWENKKAP